MEIANYALAARGRYCVGVDKASDDFAFWILDCSLGGERFEDGKDSCELIWRNIL